MPKGSFETLDGLAISPYQGILRNAIINGDFGVAQRGTSFTSASTPANSDDTYLLDRWLLLSDGNDIVDVTQQAAGGVDGNSPYIRLDVETVSKKFGILQVIEACNAKYLNGKTVTLSFEAKVTDVTKLSDIRAAVISWDGTADTVTSDIISAWGAEGVNPTLVANWTAENTAANLGLTESWVKYQITCDIDTASMANIGVFIYQNNVATNDTAGKFLEITNVQLHPGSVALPFDPRPYAEELRLCQRYYWRLGTDERVGLGYAFSADGGDVIMRYPVTMRISTLNFNFSTTAANYQVGNTTGGSVACTSAPSLVTATLEYGVIRFTSTGTFGAGGNIRMCYTAASGYIEVNGEL